MAIQETPMSGAVEDRFCGLSTNELNDKERRSLTRLALTLLAESHQPGKVLDSPESTRSYLRLQLAEYKNEVFGCVFLDQRHRIIEVTELFQGTIDGASVHPRVVVQKALELNSAAVLLFHNHPSGVAEASRADEAITKRLKAALALIDVRVLDHFIVSAGESFSFAESGLV